MNLWGGYTSTLAVAPAVAPVAAPVKATET